MCREYTACCRRLAKGRALRRLAVVELLYFRRMMISRCRAVCSSLSECQPWIGFLFGPCATSARDESLSEELICRSSVAPPGSNEFDVERDLATDVVAIAAPGGGDAG